MIGQTISHYKILEKLGEGGMGVVYKAHDTTLDRDVALKFLPRDISPVEEERTRFIHEAKAASALDHPNICTIYEVNQTPDGQMFIAMGYYEGRSISKMVEKGRLDVREAVSIAIQVAEGLQAAHEKGIVHRDVKSSNIIVSDKGQVRILDFGLARRKGLSKLTKTGMTVGTAMYMSPEQARGETVDQRTDLWSLGVVLYEMVTGRLPFRGEHEAAMLYSVVNEEPQPVEDTVSGASPELIHIIHRALEKDVAERYQSATDLLIDLRRLNRETSPPGLRPFSESRIIRQRKTKAVILGFVMVVCFAALYLVFNLKRSSVINPDWKQHPLQIPYTDIHYPGISGDGNWIGFSAADPRGAWGLYLMNVRAGQPRFIAPLPFATQVDVSADGSLLLYTVYGAHMESADGFVVYSTGGDPLKIIQGGCFGARFRPDGKRAGYILGIYPTQTGSPSPSGKLEFWSAGIDGSDPHREFIDSVSLTNGSVSFSYSPDGKKVAWLRTFPGKYQEIIVHDLETGQENIATSDRKTIWELEWAREEQIIYTSERNGIYNVYMIHASGGDPVQITHGVEKVTGIKSSADGQKIIYEQQKVSSDFWVVNIDENRSQQIRSIEENKYSPALSPDGKEIAFIVSGGYPNPSHIFVMDTDGGNRRQLSFGDEIVHRPMWSPDGRNIAYCSLKITEAEDSARTYVVEPSKPGLPRYIAHGYPQEWLDSAEFQVQTGSKSYLFSLDGTPSKEVYEDSTVAMFIRGGKYILARELRQGMDTAAWWIVDGTKPRDVQRKTARLLPWHTQNIKLSGDGNILFSIRGAGEVWRMDLPDGKEERIRADLLGVDHVDDISPGWDGKEMIITKWRFRSTIVMIENLFK